MMLPPRSNGLKTAPIVSGCKSLFVRDDINNTIYPIYAEAGISMRKQYLAPLISTGGQGFFLSHPLFPSLLFPSPSPPLSPNAFYYTGTRAALYLLDISLPFDTCTELVSRHGGALPCPPSLRRAFVHAQAGSFAENLEAEQVGLIKHCVEQ